MASTTPPITGDHMMPIERTAPWAVNFHSDDFIAGSLNAELKSAPSGYGRALYLTHVTIGLVAGAAYGIIVDARITLVDGAGTEIFGPVTLQADGQSLFSKDFRYPLKITNEKAIDVSGVCSNGSYQAACFVFAEGFTGDKPLG